MCGGQEHLEWPQLFFKAKLKAVASLAFIPASVSRCFHGSEVFFSKRRNTAVSVTLAELAASSTGWKRNASNRYGGEWTCAQRDPQIFDAFEQIIE